MKAVLDLDVSSLTIANIRQVMLHLSLETISEVAITYINVAIYKVVMHNAIAVFITKHVPTYIKVNVLRLASLCILKADCFDCATRNFSFWLKHIAFNVLMRPYA